MYNTSDEDDDSDFCDVDERAIVLPQRPMIKFEIDEEEKIKDMMNMSKSLTVSAK